MPINYNKWDSIDTSSSDSDDGGADGQPKLSPAEQHKARGDALFHRAEQDGDPALYVQSASCYQDVLSALKSGAKCQEGVEALSFKCHLNLATAMIKLNKLATFQVRYAISGCCTTGRNMLFGGYSNAIRPVCEESEMVSPPPPAATAPPPPGTTPAGEEGGVGTKNGGSPGEEGAARL